MAENSEIIEVLNDLILINNDRVEGYKKAYDEADASDSDLRTLYTKLSDDSRQFSSELASEVTSLGGEPATGTMLSGKIYRTWMDVRAVFSNNDRQTSLDNSEFGEDAAQKAYNTALQSEDITADLRSLILKQQATLKVGHDTIKRLRDAEKVLN